MSDGSCLAAGMRLVGEIRGEGDLRIDGSMDGSIELSTDVHITGTGSVRGDVKARGVRVEGTLLGDIGALEWIRIEPSGRMVGDLRAPRVQVLAGAKFRGHVQMPEARSGMRLDAKPAVLAPVTSPDGSVSTSPAPPASAPSGLEASPVRRGPPVPRVPQLGRARARRKDPGALPEEREDG